MSEEPRSDPAAARDLAAVLTPDETVLWAGRPDERRYVRVDPRLIALGVFWTVVAGAAFVGFSLTLFSDDFAGVSLGVRVALLAVAAAPFVAVSIYALGGHVAVRHRTRLRTAYAVTATRVLALRPALGGVLGRPALRELPRDRVATPVLEHLRHGTGSIDFHDGSHVLPPVRFESVRGAETIAALVGNQCGEPGDNA